MNARKKPLADKGQGLSFLVLQGNINVWRIVAHDEQL